MKLDEPQANTLAWKMKQWGISTKWVRADELQVKAGIGPAMEEAIAFVGEHGGQLDIRCLPAGINSIKITGHGCSWEYMESAMPLEDGLRSIVEQVRVAIEKMERG